MQYEGRRFLKLFKTAAAGGTLVALIPCIAAATFENIEYRHDSIKMSKK